MANQDIYVQDLSHRLQPPSADHLLSTGELSRDIYSQPADLRSADYARYRRAGPVIITPRGLIIGTAAGYFVGLVDMLLMRLVNIFLVFPSLILALAFVASLGLGLANTIIASALSSWPLIAYLARAETLSIRKMDYISAIRLQGASS